MSYPPPPGGQQPGWDPNQQPPQQPGWNPSQPPPPQQPGGYPPQQPGYPPQQPGYPPQQPGQPSPPPGMGAPQPGMGHQQPGGYGPPPGMPPDAPGGYPQQPPPKKGGTGLIIGIGAGALALVVGLVLVITQPWDNSSSGGGPSASDGPEDVAEELLANGGDYFQGNYEEMGSYVDEIRPYLCSSTEQQLDEMVRMAEEAPDQPDLGFDESDLEDMGLDESDLEDLDLGDLNLDDLGGHDFDFPEPNLDYTVTGSEIDGDSAEVSFEVSYDTLDVNTGEETRMTDSHTYHFEQEDDVWKLCDDFGLQ